MLTIFFDHCRATKGQHWYTYLDVTSGHGVIKKKYVINNTYVSMIWMPPSFTIGYKLKKMGSNWKFNVFVCRPKNQNGVLWCLQKKKTFKKVNLSKWRVKLFLILDENMFGMLNVVTICIYCKRNFSIITLKFYRKNSHG